MLLFFIIVFAVYFLVNGYLFLRGWQALEGLSKLRILYLFLFCLFAGSFFPAFFLKKVFDSIVVEVLWNIASFWLSAMLYLFLFVLAIDIFRLFCHCIGKPIYSWMDNYRAAKRWIMGMITVAVLCLLTVGYIRATRPEIVEYDLSIKAGKGESRQIDVVVVGDLHLGLVYGRSHLEHWVNCINRLYPDVVLMVGDVIDDNPQAVERKQLGELLQELEAPLGTYAVVGNHELMGDLPRSVDYLQLHGVEVLIDQSILLDSAFYLVGRMDRSVNRRKDYRGLPAKRMSLPQLCKNCSEAYPVFVMDHQPLELEEAELSGVDLQLSGHTHRGQLWPLNYLTEAMFEHDHGLLRKGSSAIVVTSGLGTWGPPVRMGSRSEIILLHLHFYP